jgi:hypothetical protein
MEERKNEKDAAERAAENKEAAAHRETPDRKSSVQPRAYPDIVDDTLDDSFPASDPPSWAGK